MNLLTQEAENHSFWSGPKETNQTVECFSNEHRLNRQAVFFREETSSPSSSEAAAFVVPASVVTEGSSVVAKTRGVRLGRKLHCFRKTKIKPGLLWDQEPLTQKR